MNDATTTISAGDFYDEFKACVMERTNELIACWSDTPRYTGLILDSILKRDVAGRLGLIGHPQYYYLDLIMYKEKDSKEFGDFTTYATHIPVAIEHENIGSSSTEEMNKLQQFRAGLRVLITYAKPSEEAALLDRYARIINLADIPGLPDTRHLLVIFGDRDTDIRWSAHEWRDGAFHTLSN